MHFADFQVRAAAVEIRRMLQPSAGASHTGEVLYAYVDESERADTHYFLGAIVCTSEQSELLTTQLDDLIAKHAKTFPALRLNTEIHGSSMMRAADEPWRSLPIRLRLRMLDEVLDVVEQTGARVYVEGVDIGRQLARGYPNPTPARELAFSHLFERINDCCTPGEPQIKVVADEHHTAEISRSNFSRYRSVGTYGYRSSYLPNIEAVIDFVPSHSSRPLQAADVVTYIYNRLTTITESDPRARRAKLAMWERIGPAVTPPRGRARTWP